MGYRLPIPAQSIINWAIVHDLADEYELFRRVVRAMDNEFLTRVNKSQQKVDADAPPLTPESFDRAFPAAKPERTKGLR